MQENDKTKIDFKRLSPRSLKFLIEDIDKGLDEFFQKHRKVEESKAQ